MRVTWSYGLNMRVTCWRLCWSNEGCGGGRLVLMVKTPTNGQMFLNGRVERSRSWNLLVVLVLAGRGKQMLSKLTVASTETSQQTEAREIAQL